MVMDFQAYGSVLMDLATHIALLLVKDNFSASSLAEDL
jgi:hypothetical protein